MSFFSKKIPDKQEDLVNSTMVIKTMQDDLDAINNTIYRDVTSTEQVSTPHIPVQNPVSSPYKPAASEQSPFTPVPQKQIIQEDITPFTPQAQSIPEETTPFTPALPIQTIDETHTPFTREIKSTRPVADQGYIQVTATRSSKLVIFFTVIIILISIGGIYYFVTTRNTVSTLTNSIQQVTTLGKKPAIFSTETPNYLPLNTANATPQSIQVILTQTAQQAALLKSTKPVEFFITDEKNNPISFATFAKLSNITLSQTLLKTLGEKFSLFIYTPKETSSIGLSLEVKDQNTLQEALKSEEALLARELSPLFLGDIPTKTTATFSNGTYHNIPLRYANIHPETGLSVDYALTNQHLLIGTSMQLHHALLDIFQ